MKKMIKSFLLMFIFIVGILFISCDSPSNLPAESEDTPTTNNPESSGEPSSSTDSPSSPQTPSSPEIPVVTYKVTFITEHGTLPYSIKNGITVNENSVLKADNLPSLSAEGFAFGGWYDGETLAVANEYKVTKNVTLTAKWTVATVSYTVSFVSAHGTVPQTITLPKNTILTEENAPTLSEYGYRFDGWFDGENKIEIGSYKIKKDVELTAKWTACWIIHFDPNGGTGTMSDQLMDGDGKPHPLNKNSFVREGYTFIGWATIYNVQYGTLEYGDEANLNFYSIEEPVEGPFLYALWEPITYIIRFDSNHGKTEEIECTYEELHTYNYKDTEISNSGLYIKNWNTKPDGTGIAYETDGYNWRIFKIGDISNEKDSINTLYAQWDISSYFVVLKNGGLNSFQPVTENGEKEIRMTCKYGTSYVLSNPFENPSRYYLKYWRDEKNNQYNTGDEFTNLTAVHGGTVYLNPTWASTSYRIHFDANGGTGRDWYEIEGYYDEEVTMPENVYTRSGYTFICWEGGYPVGSKAINLGKPGDLIYVKAIWAKTTATSDFTLTIAAPAENAATIIERLPNYGTYTLNLSGECDEETIIQLGTKLKERTMTLELHLEDTEGLTKISGLSECTCLKTIYLPNETRIAANALYGCTNLQAVYFPNYITNSQYYIFSAIGENGTNNTISVRQSSDGKVYFSEGGTYANVYKLLASLLVKKFWNAYNGGTEFEGYKYEWRAE